MAEHGQLLADGSGGADIASAAGRSKPKAPGSAHASVISQANADGRILIGADIEIFPKKACPAFASLGAEAYEAKDRRLAGEQFVLLCGQGSVPRLPLIGGYKRLKSRNIMRLIEAGIIDWPPEGGRRFAMVFEKPVGRKILASPDAAPSSVSEDRLVSAVIQPAVAVLAELANFEAVHGAVNIENAFLEGPQGTEGIVLGECLSSPPSFWQHPIYEPISRAMAKSSGRGPGTIRDDLYALGVCVAMMARGENLLAGKSPQQIVYDKIENGSYGAIIGKERIPGSVAEFLRGVLSDDEEQRWGLEEVGRWLEGRRMAPKQPRSVHKAGRALVFGNQQLTDLRAVAEAFSANAPAAAAEIERGQFDTWLKHNFADKALRARFDGIGEKDRQSSPEKLVSRVCMALDPPAPVRFKGIALFPEGFGTALAEAMLKGEDIQPYGEIISLQLFSTWISQRADEIHDPSGLAGLFEKCRAALGHRTPGNGIERVLYLLNPEMYCLSPLVRDRLVFAPAGILQALEDIAGREHRPAAILDRHMTAFISVRDPRLVDPHLGYLNSPDKGRQAVGIIRTLAGIQQKYSLGPLPGLMSWLISLTPAAVEMFHDRDLRRDMAKQVQKLAGRGDLGELLALVDDQHLLQDDHLRFGWARDEYQVLMQERAGLENFIRSRQQFGMATGRQISMIASALLAIVIISGYVVQRFISGF